MCNTKSNRLAFIESNRSEKKSIIMLSLIKRNDAFKYDTDCFEK